MSSFDQILNSFLEESKKLEVAINTSIDKSQLSLSEIIPLYYQIMNVSSLISTINQQIQNQNRDSQTISTLKDTQKLISEKFNSKLHKSILLQLSNSISETTKKLNSDTTLEKSKNEIQKEAKLYDKLRQTMSTREFVEQYDKGLSHD